MTCEQISPERWRLSFSEREGLFIVNVLARLRRHYEEDPAEWTPALRAYWRGTISAGGESLPGGLEDAQEVLSEARNELRSERLALAENWIRDFELAEKRQPWQVEISAAEREEFVAMLNDRRLTLALELGISDREMESDPALVVDEGRRSAILEIDVLGHFILVALGPQIHRP